jgi:hypothetical protein
MDFRRDQQKTLTSLYEQPGLAWDLIHPPDIRPHYLSIVACLPKDISQRLILDAVGWVNNWAKNSYYIQRSSSLHLTFAEILSTPPSLRVAIQKLKEYIAANSPKVICIKLTSAKIGASGINCHVESADQHTTKFVADLKNHFSEFTIKNVEDRSISLIRYLFRDGQHSKKVIGNALNELKDARAKYDILLEFRELNLVRLDKVAQYFELLHTFPL